MSQQETDRWPSEARDLLAITDLIANRFQVMQPPADWNLGRGGGGDLDCWIEGLDPQWPLRLPPGWRLIHALQDRFSRWQWWLEGPHGSEIIDTTEDPTGFETGIGKGAMEPSAGVEAPPAARAVYFTQKRLYKRMFEEDRWREIAPLAAQDPSTYGRVLQKVFGKRVGQRIAEAGLRGEPPDAQLIASYKRARKLKLEFVRLPVYGITYGVLGAKRILRRLLLPTGLTVLVVGPDGSGKSTFAEELMLATKTLFRRQRHVHWTPGLLPPVSRLRRRSTSDFTVPHGQERHSKLASYLALLYYWADNVLGGWGRLQHTRRRTGLVLIERGWWDIAVDPRRYRMQIGPRTIKLLGSVLPKPDIVFILEGPPEVFAARKGELTEEEIDRQLQAWRQLAPRVAPTVPLDASRSINDTVSEGRERIAQKLEIRTASRVGSGWLALPSKDARFLLPRGPARAAITGLSIYHPMTPRGRLAWEAARVIAKAGGFRLPPRGQAPPPGVRAILSEHVPPRGTAALQRTNHPDRWVALVLNGDGRAHRLIKLSTESAGSSALEREAENIQRFAGRLPPPVQAPRLLDASRHALVFEPVDWLPRRRPWHLPPDVAYAVGHLAATNGTASSIAHGDFAPWNLLKTRTGWIVIDWEAADNGYPLLFDLFHYVVQSHALLGRPTQKDIEAALDSRKGILADAITRFLSGAGSDWESLHAKFVEYLHMSRDMFDPEIPEHKVSIEARDRLLAMC